MNELEIGVLRAFISAMCPDIDLRNEHLRTIKITSRDYSGAGFMLDRGDHDELKAFAVDVSMRWDGVGATLNGQVDSGYLVYVDGGKINAVDGFTYREDWPCRISEFEFVRPTRQETCDIGLKKRHCRSREPL